jgi:hypothetical protein
MRASLPFGFGSRLDMPGIRREMADLAIGGEPILTYD